MKKYQVGSGLAVLVSLSFLGVRSDARNETISPALSIEHFHAVPADVKTILEAACYDCHSQATSWPLYSHLPGVGTLVEEDVRKGRRFLDFSNWASLVKKGKEEEAGLLAGMCENVRMGPMPPSRYRMVHPKARMTEESTKKVCNWAEGLSETVLSGAQTSSSGVKPQAP